MILNVVLDLELEKESTNVCSDRKQLTQLCQSKSEITLPNKVLVEGNKCNMGDKIGRFCFSRNIEMFRLC